MLSIKLHHVAFKTPYANKCEYDIHSGGIVLLYHMRVSSMLRANIPHSRSTSAAAYVLQQQQLHVL
jgi:hypothetical protein